MFKESPNERGRQGISKISKLFAILLSVALVLCLSSCGLYSSSSASSSKSSSSATSSSATTDTPKLEPYEHEEPEPYLDERWPTTDIELLAIPEKYRWYNARSQVGSYGTVAGPIVGVNHATNSNGRPIFIYIGKAYPDPDCVEIVVWEDRASDFESLLNDVTYPNAWIEFTGYISDYNGYIQFNVDDGSTFWTVHRNVE